MTDRTIPGRVYRRDDPGVDPPGIPIGLDLEAFMAEGDAVLFVDHAAELPRAFELLRVRGTFRISHGVAPPGGVFASAQAAVREGWAQLDALPPDFDGELGRDLPPIAALIDGDDPNGGFR